MTDDKQPKIPWQFSDIPTTTAISTIGWQAEVRRYYLIPEAEALEFIRLREVHQEDCKELSKLGRQFGKTAMFIGGQAAQTEIELLREQVMVMRKALLIYAEKDIWSCSSIANITGGYDSLFHGEKAYEIAQQALEKCNG